MRERDGGCGLDDAARHLRGSPNGDRSRQEFVEFAYGQAALEDPAVTREIVERVVAEVLDDDGARRWNVE